MEIEIKKYHLNPGYWDCCGVHWEFCLGVSFFCSLYLEGEEGDFRNNSQVFFSLSSVSVWGQFWLFWGQHLLLLSILKAYIALVFFCGSSV